MARSGSMEDLKRVLGAEVDFGRGRGWRGEAGGLVGELSEREEGERKRDDGRWEVSFESRARRVYVLRSSSQ